MNPKKKAIDAASKWIEHSAILRWLYIGEDENSNGTGIAHIPG